MPNFIFKSIDKEGVIREGEIHAYSKLEAIDYLTRQNLKMVSLVESGGAVKSWFDSLFQEVTILDKIVLVKNLSAIIKAGISLPEALDILINNTEKKIIKKILIDARLNLGRGQSLSSTFESWPQYFSVVFTELIKSGEVSGSLEKNLEYLEAQLTRDNELVKKIKSAMIYPVVILITLLIVIFVLTYFVLPRLLGLFEESGLEINPITKVFLKVGAVLNYSPSLNLSILTLLILLLIYFLKSQRGRMLLVSVLFYLPGIGSFIKKIALARFASILENLLSAGIPLNESLSSAAAAIGQPSYKRAILELKESVKKGFSIAELLEKRKDLFPPLIISMISIGEKTGTLEKALMTIGNLYLQDVNQTIKNLVSLIEPVLLLIMGVIIGGVALAILLPIYSLVGIID